ncbi:hypothetical protein AAVH_43432, partial [Aphelenchoides avenae]
GDYAVPLHYPTEGRYATRSRATRSLGSALHAPDSLDFPTPLSSDDEDAGPSNKIPINKRLYELNGSHENGERRVTRQRLREDGESPSGSGMQKAPSKGKVEEDEDMPSDTDDVKPPARSGQSALTEVDLSLSLYERVKSRHHTTVSMPKPVPGRHYGRALGSRRAISDDELVANGDSEEEEQEPRRYMFRERAVKSYVDDWPSRNNRQSRSSARFDPQQRMPRSRSQSESHRRSSKRNRRRKLDHESSSSTSSSSDDEGVADAKKDLRDQHKFEKRQMRSMEKGRARFMPINMA